MDRMERPDREEKKLSVIAPHSLYTSIRKIALLADINSLGAVCRDLLAMMPYPLYARLYAIASRDGVPVTALYRQILEEGLKARESRK